MATPRKPWKAEYAKSGRSSCKTCKSPIGQDVLRLGKMVVATQFDGVMPMWNHASCILRKPKQQIKAVDDVEGIDLLRWEDQEKIQKYVEGGPVGNGAGVAVSAADDCAIEVSQTSRAACKHCSEKIMKGMVRVSSKQQGQGVKGVGWYHINCYIQMNPSADIEKLSGWDCIPSEEKATLVTLIKKDETSEGAAKEAIGTKRKKAVGEEQKPKISKTEASASGVSSIGKSSELESKLKEQSIALWEIKDALKKHVSTAEMRLMLKANGQDSAGSENSLRDCCADGMLFGALGECPVCSGSLDYSEGQYKCHGYISAWSKCLYSTTEPKRLQQKWKIPDEIGNEFLSKWSKSQKARKPARILPPVSNKSPVNSPIKSQTLHAEKLEELKIVITGEVNEQMEDCKKNLLEAGGKIQAKVTKDISCLILSGELDNSNPEIKKAKRMKIPIVRDEYLSECIKKQKKLPFDRYKVEAESETSKGMVTVKVKGRSAVHEASGLQDRCHILEDGKSIYNTTLNMSDLVRGVNSYYILQIIQEDRGSDCYVFRKWGRVGNEKIGGSKLEEMSKDDAILEFKRLFLEKTGNPWEAWEQKHDFQKHPGKFFPLDIDFGVKQAPKEKDLSKVKSQLAPPLLELMKTLFNIETYRAAMMEFEINMSEMPLGKLSKMNIHKGFEVLTEIQNILKDNSVTDPHVRESLIVDASNRFFTLIPSIHPHVIRDEDDFSAKVKMLDALQDIEIASKLVGFDGDDDESLDEKYKKLQCDITSLPHDSEDYQLVKKYLLNTHAPTHKDWSLELEEVFALDRAGEADKYAPLRDKLNNKMLLWHGSRLTNFVGILSQGLRIAPPEAPATGYMFGKGVYFADLVSKSAQYCFVDRENPVGLMLLSEVALGEIHELKKATYIEKPPRGKHSTKGLGKTVPLESEFEKWRDVTVPCGKPVPSSVRSSELLYNEYIVYNTSQVKMQFLLKVKFNHKR